MQQSISEHLCKTFQLNYRVIKLQTENLTHADSLLQPTFRGNCLNWVLGHILESRNDILELLTKARVWEKAISQIYSRGSEPLTDGQASRDFLSLLADLDKTQETLVNALQETTEADFRKTIQSGKRLTTVWEHIVFLSWHETYHIGQMELLRQLAGKNDQVI